MSVSEVVQEKLKSSLSKFQTRRGMVGLAVVALIIVLPFILEGIEHGYLMYPLGLVFLFVIAVTSFELLYGFSGQINLGHSAFIGIGAYVSGLLFVQERFSVYGWTQWLAGIPDLPIPVTILLGGIASAVFGLILALVLMRLRGFFLAIITALLPLVFGHIVGIYSELLGSHEGFSISVEGLLWSSGIGQYYITFFAMIGCVGVMLAILRSRMGLMFETVRDNENLAEAIGISTFKYKIYAFMISAFFAGIVGAMMGHYTMAVNPHLFGIPLVLLIILSHQLGGVGTFWGPIVGGFIVYSLKLFGVSLILESANISITRPDLMLFVLIIILLLVYRKGLYDGIIDRI